MSAEPILVVCHEATRTGSTRVIIDLLESTHRLIDRPLSIRALAGGPLLGRLLALSSTDQRSGPPAAAVVNSALTAGVIEELPPDLPILLYVHECGAALRSLPERARAAMQRENVTVLAVSSDSLKGLVHLGVPAERISILPPVVRSPAADQDAVVATRRELQPEGHKPLVVGCGEASWRKGTDLFVQLASAAQVYQEIDFVWVGRRPRGFARTLDADVALSRLGHRLRWLGEVAEPAPVLACADLVALTSREDPQPLVPLEAALHGTATVAFDLGGGAELRDLGAVAAVPYPDVRSMAVIVHQLLSEDGAAQSLAESARGLARSRAPQQLGPLFAAALSRVVRSRVIS